MSKQAPWVILPTANAELASKTLGLWKDCGYMTAVLANGPAAGKLITHADICITEDAYRGWGKSLNHLARVVFDATGADIVVGGNDDIHPDLHRKAADIAAECREHWGGLYGVMQPCGDSWMHDAAGKSVSERICYSPWLGREFCRRWNGGQGAFWPEYHHYGADEELQTVSAAAGLLWQRPDLCQFHDHFSRFGRERPAYMAPVAANYWQHDTELYRTRLAAGFPGSAPIA